MLSQSGLSQNMYICVLQVTIIMTSHPPAKFIIAPTMSAY